MNPFVQGLIVSGVGIVILFITATIFYFLIVVLQRIFPGKEEQPKEAAREEPVIAEVAETSDEEAMVAAIAVAINLGRARIQSGLGDAIQEGRGVWWSANLLSAREEIRSSK